MESNKEYKFDKPLVIFRIKSEKVYDITQKIIKFLINKNYVEYIFLQELESINSEILYGNKDKEKYFRLFDLENEDSNICIIIGGDGPCLLTNSLYKDKKKPPFFSFQGGNLGFLAIYELEKYEEIFNELYTNKNFNFIHRKEIICNVYEKENKQIIKNVRRPSSINLVVDEKEIHKFEGYTKKPIKTYNALNEVYLEKTANMSHLYLYLEDHFLAKVSSDGCLFATPTGSTAYSLSAGGPILHNDVDGIIVTAICPFSLSFRPIVLPSKAKLRVKNNPSFPDCYSAIKMDGINKGKLDDNQYLEISLSNSSIDFIVLKSTKDSLNELWIQKISKSLGWNYAFTHG